MRQPSETDPLLLFPSEKDLPDGRPEVLQVVQPPASKKGAYPAEPETVGRSHPLSPPERRGHGLAGRLLVVGSLTIGLAVGVVWLAARPTSSADGATVDRPPTRFSGDKSATPSELALAGFPRSPRITPEAAPEELVTSGPETEMAASDGAQLSLGDSGVGTDVVDRQLVGRSDTFPSGSNVVFWTLVLGGRPGEEVRHVWLRDGRTVSDVPLPVEGPQWRTHSRLRLEPDGEGNWVVEARDLDERVLARHRFRSEPPS